MHVDKELWGDTFRAAPRLTPLEARAIRLALEYVGPMIAADAHTPLSRVRKKLEETFGQFELARTPEPHVATEEVDLVSSLARGMRERKLVEIEYQKEADSEPSTRLVEPYSLEPRAAELVRPHVGPDERRRAVVPPRPDAEREADARAVRAARRTSSRRGSATRARREVLYDEGDRPLGDRARRAAPGRRDGTRASDPTASDEWLESEVLAGRGEAVLLEPDELRHIDRRARQGAGEGARRRAASRSRLAATAAPHQQTRGSCDSEGAQSQRRWIQPKRTRRAGAGGVSEWEPDVAIDEATRIVDHVRDDRPGEDHAEHENDACKPQSGDGPMSLEDDRAAPTAPIPIRAASATVETVDG